MRYRSGVVRVWRESRHTVCHLGGGGLSGAACCDAGAWSGWGAHSALATNVGHVVAVWSV